MRKLNHLSARENAIVERVKERRRQQGLSQEDLAAALGLSKAGFGHYDRGTQPYSVDQLFSLSRVLGCSVAWLLGLDTTLTPAEDALLAAFRNAPDDKRREIMLDTVRRLAE